MIQNLLSFFLFSRAEAHVGYVVPEETFTANQGLDFSYLLSIFNDPLNSSLVIGTLLLVPALYAGLSNSQFMKKLGERIEEQSFGYSDFFSWALRLSAGIALIGAGTANVFISPILQAPPWAAFAQTLAGFLILAGFLLGPALVVALGLYVYAVFQDFYILGNLDFFAVLLGVLLFADSRPGVDHLLRIPFLPSLQRWKAYAPLVLRVGLGVAMTFLALYEKILNPHVSTVVVYAYKLREVIPVSPEMWVFSTGMVELFIGLALIFGFLPRLISAIAFVVLSLSFFYFQEAVYSHITLFGALSMIFVTQGGVIMEESQEELPRKSA